MGLLLALFKSEKMVKYEFEWIDAASEGGWHDKDLAIKKMKEMNCLCTSLAWLIDEDDEFYYTAASQNETQWGDLFKIPKPNVVAMHLLVIQPEESKDKDRKIVRGKGSKGSAV